MTKKASQLPGYKLRLLRQQLARRKANLLDPNWLPVGTRDNKRFPIFYPGMGTAAYVAEFSRINSHRPMRTLSFTHRTGPAPMLDPLVPEVIEEVLP